jgi:hypothetical protein
MSRLERQLDASVKYLTESERQKSMNAIATIPTQQIESAAIESVLAYGDLTKLSSSQRTAYYARVCESLGLNPLTRPFEFINLSGKLVFYARRDCTDQLRKIHNVSIQVVSRERIDEVYVVTSRASFPNGRVDESTGAVAIGNLKGEALANALMKAETKAKRRVTLSICGLSVLDETELDSLRDATPLPIEQQPPRISPHGEPDDEPEPDDSTEFERLMGLMVGIETDLNACRSYVAAASLRERLGSKATPAESALTRDLQAAREQNLVGFEQRRELSRIWQRLDRQVAKLEAKFADDAAAHVVEDAEDFPRE